MGRKRLGGNVLGRKDLLSTYHIHDIYDDRVGSKSHCRAVLAVPSPIWCASNLIFIDDVSFKL